jgi:hypothetical protein
MKAWNSSLLISFVLFHTQFLQSAAPQQTSQTSHSAPAPSPSDLSREWSPVYGLARRSRASSALGVGPEPSPVMPRQGAIDSPTLVGSSPQMGAAGFESVRLDPLLLTSSGRPSFDSDQFASALSFNPSARPIVSRLSAADTPYAFFQALELAARKQVDASQAIIDLKRLLTQCQRLDEMVDSDGNNCLHHVLQHNSPRCLKIIMEHIGDDDDLLRRLWEQANNAGRTPEDYLAPAPDPAILTAIVTITERLDGVMVDEKVQSDPSSSQDKKCSVM